jgi:molybdopterin-containing oxidoreductase family iron-sulfur binding subunit
MNEGNQKKYWTNPERRDIPDSRAAMTERDEILAAAPKEPWQMDRRGFLKLAGFSAAGLAAASCQRGPVQKAIPWLVQPEEMTPGKAYWFASACGACPAACGVLVKNRDGRPIKLEGNPAHPLSRGGLCAAGQASVLGLYDSHRLRAPLVEGRESAWAEADAALMKALEALGPDARMRVILGSGAGPSAEFMLERFLQKYPGAKIVPYDALSSSAIMDAHALTHGRRVLPRYRFDLAGALVAVDADFLSAWISPVEHAAGYRMSRSLDGKGKPFCRHMHFESRLSLTGSNADRRVAAPPAELPLVAGHLAMAVAALAGAAAPFAAVPACGVPQEALNEAAEMLWAARGRSLFVCGLQHEGAQLAVNFINETLGNYGATLDVERPSLQRRGDDGALETLFGELQRGEVDVLFVQGVNPLAELGAARKWKEALSGVKVLVSFASHLDETAEAARFVFPEPHWLASWSDAEPAAGIVSLVQPVTVLGHGRNFAESLSAWAGESQSALEIVRGHWRKEFFPRQSRHASFEDFWNAALQDGFAELSTGAPSPASFRMPPAGKGVFEAAPPTETGALSLVLYAKTAIGDGRHALNPWLQELPDPVSKVVWDNYAALAPETARRLGLRQGSVVKIEAGGESLELPVFLQPGQHEGTLSAALGYGRKGTERFSGIGPKWISGRPTMPEGGRVGGNAACFLSLENGLLRYGRENATIRATGRVHDLACTQDYHSLEVPPALAAHAGEKRPIVRETDHDSWRHDPSSGNEPEPALEDIWKTEHVQGAHRWAMAIDLSACTGCSGCVVACQAENNVPVVGKDEVRRHREMHWLRIDRYYSETPEGGVDVVHQPMLCQHCGHASCETVCPVLATVHSAEGLNQQVYNRCVGTRYCANNCAYKVRRFNWFEYAREERLENLVLNPDVTVRSRGVMEKCSFCVQRIQEAKAEALARGEALADGAVLTACQQSCPSRAIVFGDLKDPASEVSRLMKDPRRYRVLTELGVQPSVGYLTKVRARGGNGGAGGGGSHA